MLLGEGKCRRNDCDFFPGRRKSKGMTVPRPSRENIAAIQKTHKKEAYAPIRKVSLNQIPFNDTL